MKKTAIILSILSAASLALGAADKTAQIGEKYNEAMKIARTSTNPDDAEKALKFATTDDQKADVYRRLFDIHSQNKDLEKAKIYRDKIGALNCHKNKKNNVYHSYARLCFQCKKKDLGREAWNDCANRDSSDMTQKAIAKIHIADSYWGDRKNLDLMIKLFMEVANDEAIPANYRVDALKHAVNKGFKAKRQYAKIIDAVHAVRKSAGSNLVLWQIFTLADLESTAYFELGKKDQALKLYDDLLHSVKDAEPAILEQKARMLARYSDIAAAAETMGAAAVGKASKTDLGGRQRLVREMAKLYVTDNQKKASVKKSADILLKLKHQNDAELASTYLTLIEIAINAGEYAQAEEWCKTGSALKDLNQRSKDQFASVPCRIAAAANDLEKLNALLQPGLSAAEVQPDYVYTHRALFAKRMFEQRKLGLAGKYYSAIPAKFIGQNDRMGALMTFALLNQNEKLVSFAKQFGDDSKTFYRYNKNHYDLIATLVENPAAEIKLDAKLKDTEKAVILSDAAKFFISADRQDIAKKVHAVRSKMFRPVKQNELVIRYVKNAPNDVGSWLNSSIIKDKKNRAEVLNKYGEAEAAYLYTDVMAAGRVVGDSSVQADKETYFYCCYDEYGLHLFFVGVDSKVKDILAGKIGGSGYEMYLAVGEGAPPYQWLFNQPKDKLHIPFWCSPHKYYRTLDDYVNISSRATENGIATAMNFSWDLAYDRLPANGDTWPFELIRWTRGGGVTWGGTCVWQIGNWGRLRFDGLSEDVLNSIRSIIIGRAFGAYTAQKEARTGGKIALWQDAELGDPEFYEKALKPEVERLDKLGTMISNDMDAATIQKLWKEAVPDWFDFNYRAAELRRKYLNDRLITTGK